MRVSRCGKAQGGLRAQAVRTATTSSVAEMSADATKSVIICAAC